MIKHYAVIETKQNGKTIKEHSPMFDNQLQSETWLGSACREARSLNVRIIDHYLMITN